MIIPSLFPLDMNTYNNDDPSSSNIRPTTEFLHLDSSSEATDNKPDRKTNTKHGSVSFSEDNTMQIAKDFPIKSIYNMNNVLIQDFDTKNSEFQNMPIKRNKFHDLIFQSDSNDPIRIRLKSIFNQAYPKEYQSCFIPFEQEKREDIIHDLAMNLSDSFPEITVPYINNFPKSLLDVDTQNQIHQKKQPFRKMLVVKESSRPPSEGVTNLISKNLLNNKPIKPRQNFTEEQRSILNSYLQAHSNNPYAGSKDVARLVEITGLQPRQIRTYFTNKRMRDAKCMNLVTAKRCRSLT